MSRFYIVQGQTAPIDVQLLRDRQPLDLSGLAPGSVTLLLRGVNGIAVETAGDVSILEAATGKVRYTPSANAFAASPGTYSGRWRVVDGDGAVAFWPNRAVDLWIVG